MQYLMGSHKYDAAVFLFAMSCNSSVLRPQIRQVAEAYLDQPLFIQTPPPTLGANTTLRRLVLRCLAKRCPTPAALENLFDVYKATYLELPTTPDSRQGDVIVFIEAFTDAGLTHKLKAVLHDFGSIRYRTEYHTLVAAYAATSNLLEVLKVLEEMRRKKMDIRKAGETARDVLEKAGCTEGVSFVQTYMRALCWDEPLVNNDVPKVVELLEMLKTSREVEMASVYIAVVARLELDACPAGVRAALAHSDDVSNPAEYGSDAPEHASRGEVEEESPCREDNAVSKRTLPFNTDLAALAQLLMQDDALQILHQGDAVGTRRRARGSKPLGQHAPDAVGEFSHPDASDALSIALAYAGRQEVDAVLQVLDQHTSDMSKDDLVAVLNRFVKSECIGGALAVEERLLKHLDHTSASEPDELEEIAARVRALWLEKSVRTRPE
ncbi:hypothetical protein C8R44DRAFT_122965 [Mycena epipterygia]|nr:hypothetical protein C8R44DRAFT_122965 [Mycena epipterygia]